jgi:Fe-S cluster assembly protein SufD
MTEALLETREAAVSRLIELASSRAEKGPEWFEVLRREARESFGRLGFPTRKDESWRLTDLSRLAATNFVPAPAVADQRAQEAIRENRFADLGCPRIVFANGRLVESLSTVSQLPAGVEVGSLRAALREDSPVVSEHLGRYAGFREHPFSALNLAFAGAGAVVQVTRGTVVEEPIQIVFLSLGGAEPVMTHPRVLIIAEPNSEVRVVETHVGSDEAVYFNNSVTEVLAQDGAVVDYYKFQQDSGRSFHLGTIETHQLRSSNVRSSVITLGGGLVRNDTGAVLNGEGGWAELDGLSLVGDDHHLDNFTRIEHLKAHCDSRELYKGILMDRATGVFRGRIVVAKGAQRTDSKQTNNNLLLSDHAQINTKPQLEIYADDVKCTHGATVGQLDPDAIFYLRARGISLAAARSILTYAFASEVVGRVKVEPLREALDRHLFEWLPMGRVVKQAF